MPIFSAAWRTASGGSTALPIGTIYPDTTTRVTLLEVGCWNTTTAQTAAIAIRRVTSSGTPGLLISNVYQDTEVEVPTATVYDTHTSGPTIAAGYIRRATLAAGNGVIWVFDPPGLIIPAGGSLGVCLIPATGTGRVCDVSFTWAE